MSGNDPEPTKQKGDESWYVLRNEMTGQPVGYINAAGETRDTDSETRARVNEAFDRELLVRDGEAIEDFGVCADGVCSIGPADPKHDQMVLRNLGALTGLRPERRGISFNDESDCDA